MWRQKKIDKLRGDNGCIRYILSPSFRKPQSSAQKKKKKKKKLTVQSGGAFEDTASNSGFDIDKY